MTLFVDKIEENDFGGFTKDIRKINYNLAKYKLSIEDILQRSPQTDYPVVVFRAGQYVAIFIVRETCLTFNWHLLTIQLIFKSILMHLQIVSLQKQSRHLMKYGKK
jgi:hypothetical protein